MLKEIKTHAVVAPLPVLIVGTYDSEGNPDAMNVAWGGQCLENRIALNISSNHKTTENMRGSGCFTLHIADEDRVELADYVGIVSGHNTDKFKKVRITTTPGKYVNAPIIEEFVLAMECKVVSMTDDGAGCVRVVGEIVRTVVDDSILDECGNVDYSRLRPITYDSELKVYRSIGDIVAKAFEVGNKLK